MIRERFVCVLFEVVYEERAIIGTKNIYIRRFYSTFQWPFYIGSTKNLRVYIATHFRCVGNVMKEQVMENPHSVSSPRRVLSFSKRRKTSAAFPDSVSDKHSSGFGVSGDHGPKTSEVYGFVGSITTVVATVIFLVWAYVPEPWLHSIGIHYYPNRYWAIAVPTYAMVTVVLALLFYIGLNFMATPPVTSYNMIFDEFSREPAELAPSTEEDELPIEPISDIGINRINDLMFGDAK